MVRAEGSLIDRKGSLTGVANGFTAEDCPWAGFRRITGRFEAAANDHRIKAGSRFGPKGLKLIRLAMNKAAMNAATFRRLHKKKLSRLRLSF